MKKVKTLKLEKKLAVALVKLRNPARVEAQNAVGGQIKFADGKMEKILAVQFAFGLKFKYLELKLS